MLRSIWDTCKKPAGNLQPFAPVVRLLICLLILLLSYSLRFLLERIVLNTENQKRILFFSIPYQVLLKHSGKTCQNIRQNASSFFKNHVSKNLLLWFKTRHSWFLMVLITVVFNINIVINFKYYNCLFMQWNKGLEMVFVKCRCILKQSM
jgi:hypothetical protein